MSRPSAKLAIATTILLALGTLARVSAVSGTIMPTPFQTVLDVNGNPVSGAKVCTYTAGTTTPVATYTDVGLTVANANPIVADSSGRFTAYLTPGVSYKFVYQDSTGTAGVCDGASIKTVDNIAAVPSSSGAVDITGTAGESISAGQCAYLSDGSGSKNAGQWYKCDTTNAYSNTTPEVGIATAAIGSGSSGSIRIAGQVTGLSSLSTGSDYFAGSSGALTSTPSARYLGRADSATSLVVTANPRPVTQQWVNDFRLTLTTATPVTTADVTAATTIYCSPLLGNRIDLPDSAGNPVRLTSAEFSIAVPATTSQMYDVFAYNSSGTATLELLAWTNDTTRATAVVRTTNGRLLKSGDNTRLYLGSFRTTGVSGQTEDSFAKRYLWNYYNRAPRILKVFEATDSWTYTTATYRQANGNTANQLDVVIGWAEIELTAEVRAEASNNGAGATSAFVVAIGEDSTSSPATNCIRTFPHNPAANTRTNVGASLRTYPAVGRHFYAWLEYSVAAGTTTWSGDLGGTVEQAGIIGSIQG